MELALTLASVFVVGLLGGGHCLGMCGGIMGALSLASGAGPRWLRLALYNAGRLAGYGLLGLLAGFAGAGFAGHWDPALRLVAGLLLILMGLYLAGWWRALVWLERGGALLWVRLQPLSRKLLPLRSTWQALPLGFLWGFLPCGLVYTALAYAAAQGSAPLGGLTMLAFGLGTLPAVLAGGLLAEQLRHLVAHQRTRSVSALLLMAFGFWTLFSAWPGTHGH